MTTNTPTSAPDLDARVAAPDVQQMAEQWHDDETLGGADCDHRVLEITAYKAGYAAALRAELQKPALHEPVSDQETIDAIRACHLKVTTESMIDMRRAIDSVLQGRAKPAQNNLAGLLAALYYGQYSTNEDKKSLDKNIELALKNYDIGAGEFVQPAQEEITDAEIYKIILKMEQSPSFSYDTRDRDLVRAGIRASKGEKT